MKKYSLQVKLIVVGIIFFLVGTCIIPAAAQIMKKSSLPESRGNWLYVGGSGPGNYSTIQEAMKNASNGDTIYVYSGLYGTLTIRKSLNIIGENKYTTILNGTGRYDTVSIEANDVTLSGFTIQNGGTPGTTKYGRGISLQKRTNVTVSDVILTNNYLGIIFYWCTDVLLYNINFINKAGGVSFWDGRNCTITHCIFDNSGISHNGFPPSGSNSLYIRNNLFTNNSSIGLGYLCIDSHGDTTIESNQFENNSCSISTYLCKGVNILGNNFINNTKNVQLVKVSYIREILHYISFKQHWKNNYWDDWNQDGPYTIQGDWTFYIGFGRVNFQICKIPFKEYDHYPAKEPYNI